MKGTWIKLSTLKPGCASDAMFGCTEFKKERDWLYPDRLLKLGSAIIWVPSAKAHVSVASYVDARKTGDSDAIAKLESIGIPAGIDFGYSANEDLSCMYEIEKKKKEPGKKKKDSVKVMRAEHAAEFEDGTRFEPGEIVKILFRKKYVESRSGAKVFRNAYLRPSEEELAKFLEEERGA